MLPPRVTRVGGTGGVSNGADDEPDAKRQRYGEDDKMLRKVDRLL